MTEATVRQTLLCLLCRRFKVARSQSVRCTFARDGQALTLCLSFAMPSSNLGTQANGLRRVTMVTANGRRILWRVFTPEYTLFLTMVGGAGVHGFNFVLRMRGNPVGITMHKTPQSCVRYASI